MNAFYTYEYFLFAAHSSSLQCNIASIFLLTLLFLQSTLYISFNGGETGKASFLFCKF